MAKTARQRIVDFLQNRNTASAEEISRTLHTTPANARHHLSVLTEEGVVHVVGERRTGQRGRPIQVYALSQHLTRHNLDRLASILLAINQGLSTSAPDAQIIQQIAFQLAQPVPVSQNLTQRLNQTIQHLNQMGYHARWEASAAGPRLILGHCPYISILNQHPELCQMDSFLLSTLSGRFANLESRLELGSLGLAQCMFRIETKSTRHHEDGIP